MPGLHDLMSDAEAAEALLPIIRMAQDCSRESQHAAAQIMCDLSMQEELQQQLCENGCIGLLAKLSSSPCESTRRLAIISISNLSESPICQVVVCFNLFSPFLYLFFSQLIFPISFDCMNLQHEIVNAGILPELLALVRDGPYYTAEMRRACARILAHVSARLASEVALRVGRNDLSRWMDTVDSISDEKLRMQANRARSSLQTVFAN